MLKTALLDLAAQWPTYGYRRLTCMMRRLGWPVNAQRVRRWMAELGSWSSRQDAKFHAFDDIISPFLRQTCLFLIDV
jgi:hypothetical protein